MKIAVAGIYHETNTFAPGLTTLEHFQGEWVVGHESFLARFAGTRTSMGGVIDAARTNEAALMPGLYAAATPSGMVSAETGDALIDALAASIDAGADGIVLIMHGAMVTERVHDFEGECLRRLRQRFGVHLPIAMTLDLHGNISRDMVEQADFLVGYDTYPHIDMYERAAEAFELLLRVIRGEIRPVRAYAHTGMLVVPQGMMTDAGAMKELMLRAFSMESEKNILNVTVAGGFPYSDVPDAGMSFVVTADGDPELARQYAAELARMAIDRKATFDISYVEPREAVIEALARPDGPVILAEGSDNVGGGAPGDATHVLTHLKFVSQRALIVLHDSEAVEAAFRIGVGGAFNGCVGGKSDSLHGEPVDIRGRILLLFDGQYRHIGPYMTGHQADMGRSAVIEAMNGNLTLVLTAKRVAPWDLGHILAAGLRPEDFKIIVAKSAIAWQTAFGPFAKHVVNVDSPGCCSANLRHFDYKNVRRPVYPLDPDHNPRFE